LIDANDPRVQNPFGGYGSQTVFFSSRQLPFNGDYIEM